MPRIRLRNLLECSADVPKYSPDHAREMDLKRPRETSQNADESPRTLDSWAEPPYEFLCPLGFYEVTDLRKWKDIRPAHELFEGLYICQPLVGYHKKIGSSCSPGWVLVSRILLGYRAGSYLVRTFWLTDAAIDRTEADFHRLGLPMAVADKAIEFDRGGVLGVVDEQTNPDDPRRYRVVSITGLHGIGYLHAEFLDYERARREQAAMEARSSL